MPSAYFFEGHDRDAHFPLCYLRFQIASSITLKTESGFRGMKRCGVEHRVSLYVNDLLLYVSDPLSSLPQILSLLESFSVFSVCKWNISKSKYLPINQLAIDIPPPLIPFKLAGTGIRYLGIMVTRSIRSLGEQIFTALATKINQDLQIWSHLPMSLTDRIQTVKMNILPRYLYLFQCPPIFLPRSSFNAINSCISSYIWVGKHARANKSLLQRNRSLGSLGLPNLLGYY